MPRSARAENAKTSKHEKEKIQILNLESLNLKYLNNNQLKTTNKMKRRFTILTAALALLTFLAVPMGMWGQSRGSYTITFANNSNSTTQITGSTNASTVIANDGRTYVTTQPFTVNSGSNYYGGNNNALEKSSIRMGKSGNSAGLTISLSDDGKKTATSIVINCCRYNTNNAGTISVNGLTAQSVPSSAGDLTFTFASATDITNLVLSVTKATFVCSITVNYSTGPSVTSLSYTGTPNKTQYEVGESFDPTGLTVTATYSDETTQDVTSSVVWTPNPLTAGTTSVTGTYSGLTVTVNGITVTAPADPDIVLSTSNSPFTSTSSSNTNTETVTLDGIEYENYCGYKYNSYLSFNRSQAGGYLGNNTQLCGNIKKIVINYNTGGASYLTMYEGSTALAETTTVAPSSTGTGNVTYTFSGNTGFFKLKLTTTGTFVNITSISIYLNDCSVYRVTYNANGATSGDVPVDPTEYSDENNTVTVLGNTGSLAKTGNTWSGWNTKADGTGTTYNANNTFEITGNITLYAKWDVNSYGYTLNVTGDDDDAEVELYVDGNELAANATIEYGASVTVSVILSSFADYTYDIAVEDAGGILLPLVNEAFIMPASAVTINVTTVLLPKYSVILCDDNTILTEASFGAGVSLPSRDATSTYTFAGWSTTNVENETTTAPTIIPAETYYPAQNIALYPVYTRTEGGGTTTEWHLLENLSDADAGVYALLTEHYNAFNGTISQGHGGATSGSFSFVDGVATSAPENTLEMTFEAVVGGFKMYAEGKGYLYAKDNSSGNLAWISTDSQYWSYQQQQAGNWCYSQNNAYLRSYSDNSFRTYGNNSGKLLKLAKKVEVSSSTTYYTSLLNSTSLTIAAGQWYLIASPVGNVNPIAVGSMTEDQTYGLFTFDQEGDAEGKEWLNYKAGAFSQLEAGKGYLYINQEGCILTFTGTAYSTPDGSATFPIDYYTSNPTTSFRGLNLVGNPFNEDAAINLPFYKMNATTGEIETASGLVHPMEGVFVVASENVNSVTFQTGIGYGGGDEKFSLNLTQNRGNVIDRAIVRFDEGGQLPKVQLFENSTKIYISQNGKDYAVVRSEGQGELPVNFRASENGTYTLSMDVENMDMNYLHLIDNMTGMDVDLLQTPSYTFEAKVNDYESRFRLVFAANNEDGVSTGSTTFAFYSNGSWIINNAGEATLQVVDLTGRILSSETVNGSVSKTINAVPGVYMLRLINGENVNVQKIVVR